MRFGVPRSESPSPVRRPSFGLRYSLDWDSDSDSDDVPDFDVPTPPPKLRLSMRGVGDLIHPVDETLAAVRLRTRHHDPYEDWERRTRIDSFRTARKALNTTQSRFHDQQDSIRKSDADRRASLITTEINKVGRFLEELHLKLQTGEDKIRERYERQSQLIADQTESAIKIEEDKEKVRVEAEAKQKEIEQERIVKERNEKLLELEKMKLEEEAKRKEEEIRKKVSEQHQEASKHEERRKALGFSTATEEWVTARNLLKTLKQVMKNIKSFPQSKKLLSQGRRQFTSKIGQITDNATEIERIRSQLTQIMQLTAQAPDPTALRHALFISLSKAILLQAETEVTAEKKSAKPLAKVTFLLLESLEGFSEVLFTKLVQRTGGWAIPILIPSHDPDSNKPWESDIARNKAMGYRYSKPDDDNGREKRKEERELTSDYAMRLYGIMRVYFSILKIVPQHQPLMPSFRLPRYWMWMSRMLGQRELLGDPISAQVLFIALEVLGSDARSLWGHQWDKILSLMYEGVTVGVGGDGKYLIGGSTPDGVAARSRLQMEIERIMGST